MKKTDFYNTFKGTDTQALKVGGSVKVPAKINGKAEIIEARLAGASVGWDYTLVQLQDAVFSHRGSKADWSNSGSFDARDLVTVTDIKQAMLDVYFNRQDSDFWKGSMLMLVAMKSGELVLRKVDYVEGFFKAKEDKADAKEKTASLVDDLVKLYEKNGDKYSSEDLKALEDLISKVGGEAVEFVA